MGNGSPIIAAAFHEKILYIHRKIFIREQVEEGWLDEMTQLGVGVGVGHYCRVHGWNC